MESLLESTHLRIGNFDYLFCPSRIKRNIERAQISPKSKKKLRSLFAKSWGNHNERKFIEEYLAQCQGSIQFKELVGIPFGPETAHYSAEMCRIRHVLGLADAVHLSLFNLGIKVSFPARFVKRARVGSRPQRIPSVLQKELLALGLNPKKLKSRKETPDGVIPAHRFIRSTTHNRRFYLIVHYLREMPHRHPEREYVKIIKETLVDEFCVQMGQERPKISICRINLFPPMTQNKLNKRFLNDRKGRVRFYKNLLESKSLCAPVGDDMVYQAYLDHKENLCRPESELPVVPQEFLRELYEYGKKVGKFVAKRYDPYRTKLPNSRATVETSRAKGGARAFLKKKLEIQKGPLYLSTLDGPTRVEPYVIGLFGFPGSGKTTMVQHLTQLLGLSMFPSQKGNDLVYSRSCATTHWDGYRGQPIVVMDDFGQDLTNRADLVEFEQLVSVNRYVLPMAHLEEKGRVFESPIIILTSNCPFGAHLKDSSGRDIVEDPMAVWRRFHLPLKVSKGAPLQEYSLGALFSMREQSYLEKYNGRPQPHYLGYNSWIKENHHEVLSDRSFPDVYSLGREIRERFMIHTDYHHRELSNSWRQVISCYSMDISDGPLRPMKDVRFHREDVPYRDNCVTVSQIFPRFPPYHMPVVSAIAIREPLKVRMITKAESHTKCLQPLQMCLFDYLKTQPQFVLTHGVMWGKKEEFHEKLEWIHRIEDQVKMIHNRRKEGDLWLSGDYTAATDNFPMSVTNALVEGLLSQIDHEPTKQWVRYEVSPHVINYPMGIGSGEQTSGQLMGSLLSFPLLCFLNDFIVSRSGAEPGKYLINGDDVLVLGSEKFIHQWRRDAPKVGLSLSLGKNFIDPHFVTVNSQLFYDGRVLHTGKVSLSTRYGKTLGRCFSEMQFYYGTDEELRREFIRRNLVELRKTPRCLSVPWTHGGMGMLFLDSLESERRAIEVYLTDYLRNFNRSLPIPGQPDIRALRVPIGFYSNEEMLMAGGGLPENLREFEIFSSFDLDPSDPDDNEDLTFKEMDTVMRMSRLTSERMVNQLLNRPIRQFPRLDHVRYRVIFVESGKVGFLKERILNLAMKQLLHEIDGKTIDPDEEFIEIHREFLEEQDPLFGSDFRLPTLEEEDEETRDQLARYSNLLPGLEPHLVPYEGPDEDLVFLIKGSGSERS